MEGLLKSVRLFRGVGTTGVTAPLRSQQQPEPPISSRPHLAIGFYSFAALDHIGSFSKLLPKDRPVTALAALTRGAIEASGNVHYLPAASCHI
jgi:hypothetical protein